MMILRVSQQCQIKKYRRSIVKKMNNKFRLGRGRQSNSRERTILRSGSKSQERSKGRTESRILLKPKELGGGEESEDGKIHKKLRSRQGEGMNEYYAYLRGKSKSKGKLRSGEDGAKGSYFSNVYMHKEAKVGQPQSKTQDRSQAGNSKNILNKIRLIEKNGAIDANGKFVVKEARSRALEAARSMDGMRSMESQQTISINEELKKEKGKKTIKPKNIVKNKSHKEEGRVLEMRSGERFKKKDKNKIVSPSILEKHTEKYYEAELSNNIQRMRENPFVKSRQLQKNLPPTLSTRTSKTIFSEETQTSPLQDTLESSPQPFFPVSFPSLIAQMAREKEDCLDPVRLKILYKSTLSSRTKAIGIISKLCASFRTRREAFALGVYFMDKYILLQGQEVSGKKLKFIAITSLLLALKLDDGIMSRRICHECIKNIDSIFGNKHSRNGKSKSLNKHQDCLTSLSREKSTGTLSSRSKTNSFVCDIGLIREENKRSPYREKSVHTKQMTLILALELDMLKRFSFKVVSKSSTYWADTLTMLWDDYARQQGLKDKNLLFRQAGQSQNISQCYQILEKLALSLDSHNFPKHYLVLGCIYLIFRMRMEERRGENENLLQKYAAALQKSTNLLFYDNLGVNELFGDYLSQLSLSISDLIECVQFVGKHLTPFEVLPFEGKCRRGSKIHEHQLAVYESTPGIYRLDDDSSIQ